MRLNDEQAPRLGFWILLLCSLFAWAPAAYPGYWQGWEGFIPVWNSVQSSALAGVAIAPDLWRGTGSAAFLPAQPLLLAGMSPVAATRSVFALSFLLGGLGIYTWLRLRLGDRAAGLAGVVYLLMPPFVATVYVRGSLSDALILGLLPLALAGVAAYADSHSPSAAGVVALCILWMWRVQAGLAVFATLLLLVYAAWVERSRLALLVVAVSAAAGLVSLIPLWSIRAAPPVPFDDHFLALGQLLYAVWPAAPGGRADYPFQLGFAVLVLGIMAVWLWRAGAAGRPSGVQGRMLGFALGGALILLLLSLSVSAPIWRWTGADRLLTYPWQIVLPAAPLLALLAGSVPALSPMLQRAPLWAVLVGLALLSSYPLLTVAGTQVTPPERPAAIVGARQELAILEAKVLENPGLGSATLHVTWQVLRPLPFDYNVFFQAVTTDNQGDHVLAQLDVQPLKGEQPATAWQPGDIYTARYALRVGRDTLLGAEPVRYYFGFYDWRDGARLAVDGGIDDKMILYAR
ncbi:MAG: hypothetical protein IT329_21430 [Caldilineaceae bacterium]|nr:hypothetical protein [Caldilineaceae bacterium]